MSGARTTHACPVPGCRATRLRPAMLMCRVHWDMLSPGLQAAIWSSWNGGMHTPEYAKWRAACVAHVQSLEKKP